MKSRVVLGVVALSLVAAAALAWNSVRADRTFRRLIQDGERAVADGQPLEAIEALSGALALRPDAMVAHLRRGEAYQLQGRYDRALRDLQQAVTLDATASLPLERLADVHAALRQEPAAIELYQRRLSLDERAPGVLYKLALSQYRNGQLADAEMSLRRALTLDANLAPAHYLLGLALLDQQRQDEGLSALRRAVGLDGSLVAAREALGGLERNGGQRRETFAQLEALAALESGNPDRIVGLARAYADVGRIDAAMATLERLGDDAQLEALTRVAVATVWLAAAQARGDSALRTRTRHTLETITATANADSDALALLGRIQLLEGRAALAERSLQRAIEHPPVAPSAFVDLADAATRLGHRALAYEALSDFVALTTNDAERQRALARLATLAPPQRQEP